MEIHRTALNGDDQYIAYIDDADEVEIVRYDGRRGDTEYIAYFSRDEAISLAKAILNHYVPPLSMEVGDSSVESIIAAIKAASAGTVIEVNA